MEQKSYLERLIGKIVTKTDINTSTAINLGNSNDEPANVKFEISLQLFLEEYLLDIYNPITVIPSDKELPDFVGLKVVAISDTKEEGELIFDNGYKIVVNMRDEAYYGPEAMCLYGPENLIVVWN